MTTNKVISKLLRFKGLLVQDWWSEGRSDFGLAVRPCSPLEGDMHGSLKCKPSGTDE